MYQPQPAKHYYHKDEIVGSNINNNMEILPEAQLEQQEEEEYIINDDEDDVIIDDDDVIDNEFEVSKYNRTEQTPEMENVNRYHVSTNADNNKKEVARQVMPYLSEKEPLQQQGGQMQEHQEELLYNEEEELLEEEQQMYMESELDDMDEEAEEEEEDEEESKALEEDDIPTYPLPPLPPVELPSTIHGTPTHEMYGIISEIRRLIDDSVERERVKEMLLHEPNVLAGVAQVLHECGLLRRLVIQPMSQNTVIHELLPLPLAPTPPLSAGYTSWIVEEPAAMTNTTQTSTYNNSTNNNNNNN